MTQEQSTLAGPQPITLDRAVKHFGPRTSGGGEETVTIGPIDLRIEAGQTVAIVGRSGVGKSTILRLIGSLLPLNEGAISIDHIEGEVARAKKTFGFMPQVPALLPWKTARDNVALLGQVNRQGGRPPMDADEALRIVGLAHVANDLPRTLSGGMRQRVALARTLATRAPVLLLDEPFSALDETTRLHMHDHVRTLRDERQHTIVFVTHDLREATVLADRVVVLAGQPGTVVDDRDVTAIDGSDPVVLQGVVDRLRPLLSQERAS